MVLNTFHLYTQALVFHAERTIHDQENDREKIYWNDQDRFFRIRGEVLLFMYYLWVQYRYDDKRHAPEKTLTYDKNWVL